MLQEELSEARLDRDARQDMSPSPPNEESTSLQNSLDEPSTPILDQKTEDLSQRKGSNETNTSDEKAQESEIQESKASLFSATGFTIGTDDLRQLMLLQKQLELTKLKLQLQTARTEQEVLMQKLKARQETKQRKIAVLKAMREQEKTRLKKDVSGKKLVTLLIECQSLNGIGPSKDSIKSNLEKVNELLDNADEIDLNMTDTFGRTALHLLCRISPTKLSLSALRKLIAKGQDIEVRSQCGKTCVHLCAETPNARALKILVKSGANVTVLSKSSISPTALEIAITGLKYSASEFRANSHVYADMVTSLTFWNIMQGEDLPQELVAKYGKIWDVNQAIREGRNKARRFLDITRSELLRRLKVFVLVDIVISYLGMYTDFCPLPSFSRKNKSSTRGKIERSYSDNGRSGSSRIRANTLRLSSIGV